MSLTPKLHAIHRKTYGTPSGACTENFYFYLSENHIQEKNDVGTCYELGKKNDSVSQCFSAGTIFLRIHMLCSGWRAVFVYREN